MAVHRKKKSTIARFVTPLALLAILGYFGIHAFNGQYGIRANLIMQKQMVGLEQKLAKRNRKRILLEDRVSLLREGALEKDMVDQQVRSQLNMVRADEVVVFVSE